MNFLDLFGLKRRNQPRVAVRWFVDVQVPGTDHYIGFYSHNISPTGVYLQGVTSKSFEKILSGDRQTSMRVHMPSPYQPFDVEVAFIRWDRKEADNVLTGWEFIHIRRDARRMIEAYIETHLDDILQGPGDEPR